MKIILDAIVIYVNFQIFPGGHAPLERAAKLFQYLEKDNAHHSLLSPPLLYVMDSLTTLKFCATALYLLTLWGVNSL